MTVAVIDRRETKVRKYSYDVTVSSKISGLLAAGQCENISPLR